jgi:hypothetical protein
VCSASFKGSSSNEDVLAATRGAQPIRKLYSKSQRAFFRDHAPEGIDLDAIAVLGPITVLKLKKTPTTFGRRLAVELWMYPDGSRILELSTKCRPDEAFQVAAESRAFLSQAGVDLGAEQQTKTATALRYFADQLAPA